MQIQTTQPRPQLEPLLDARELSDYLGIPLSTIYDWRTRGLGPPGYRLGKHLKFTASDVHAWLEAHRDGAETAQDSQGSNPLTARR